MVLATMMAVAASVLGGSLVVASRQPFDHAFAAQHGAHLTARFDGGHGTAAQLAATAHASGITAAAGPFPTATVDPQGGADLGLPDGASLSPMAVAGRADPRRTRRRRHPAPRQLAVGPRPDRAVRRLLQPRSARWAPGCTSPALPGDPAAHRRRLRPVGQPDRRRLGGAVRDRRADPGGQGRRLPDALPLRHGRYDRADGRRPRRGGGGRAPRRAVRCAVVAHRRAGHQPQHGAVRAVPPRLRPAGRADVGAHRRHRGRPARSAPGRGGSASSRPSASPRRRSSAPTWPRR